MSIRPRFQRAFFTWLEAARPRLALQPRSVLRSDQALYLNFDDTTEVIEVELSRDRARSEHPIEYRLWVWEAHGSLHIDPLICVSATVVRVSGSYVDTKYGDNESVYPTREAAWRAWLFEPFLKWVNDDLAPAHTLATGTTLVESIPASMIAKPDPAHIPDLMWLSANKLVRKDEQIEDDSFRPWMSFELRRPGPVVRRRHVRRLKY